MLSKTFRTAKELRISQAKYNTLVKVYWLFVDEKAPQQLFNMSTVGRPVLNGEVACGTAGCILGWCRAVDPWFRETARLDQLFFNDAAIMSAPSRAQAAQAIHNYLTTGRANWRGVLKG